MPAFRGIRAAAVVLALASAGVMLAGPASAAPPVAVDDHKQMYPGEGRLIDVLANDSDPDGDELAVCRVGPYDEDQYYVDIEGDKLFVGFFGEVDEDLVLTYYACDLESLVPATLTVSARELHPIKVTKLQRPGLLRVTNDNDLVVRFLYGSFRNERPDGRTRVFPNDSVVIRVHRHKIDWVAYLGRRGLFLGIGHVRGIELPDGDSVSGRTTIDLSRAEAELWAEQR